MFNNSRPRVHFIVSARMFNAEASSIDWKNRIEFLDLIEPYRSSNEKYDCVVPWSGGETQAQLRTN